VSFTLRQDSNPPLQFAIDGTAVRLTGAVEKSGQTDEDAVVLENNFWYQYYYLIRRYDFQKGGLQHFKAFVPSIMQTLPVTLELKEAGRTIPGVGTKLNHYHASLAVAVSIEIWTDLDGQIFYASTNQQIELVRQDQVEAIATLRKEMARAIATAAAPIDYSASAGAPFTAEEVTVKANGFTLAGTLLLPKAARRPFPAVIMITGSGQQTR